jgi:hypothetical protein
MVRDQIEKNKKQEKSILNKKNNKKNKNQIQYKNKLKSNAYGLH